MRTRLIRATLVATLIVCVGGLSVAHAQATDENTSGVGPFNKANYPQDVIDRPLTLPGGMLELSLSLQTLNLGDSTAVGVGAAYGVGNKIEVGASTGLGIDPDFEWQESLGIAVGYLAHDSKNLDVRAGARTSLDFSEGADVFNGFSLDAFTRFKLNNMIAIVGGNSLLSVRTAGETAISANVNVGVLAQVIPKLAVQLDTQLVSLAISGDANQTTHLGDVIPLTTSVRYTAQRALDVLLFVAFPSLEHASDFYVVGAGAAYRL